MAVEEEASVSQPTLVKLDAIIDYLSWQDCKVDAAYVVVALKQLREMLALPASTASFTSDLLLDDLDTLRELLQAQPGESLIDAAYRTCRQASTGAAPDLYRAGRLY